MIELDLQLGKEHAKLRTMRLEMLRGRWVIFMTLPAMMHTEDASRRGIVP
jgi:hypothetical protein